MPDLPQEHRLARLREHRVWAEKDLTLGFLKQQFQREVAKPHKQLASLIALWNELVPEALSQRCRLESLSRGVLRVAVEDSPRLYELDSLLRSGLERELIRRHNGPALRRIQLRIGGRGQGTEGGKGPRE